MNEKSSRPPYGYRREGNRLAADPVEGPIRKRMYELFLQHGRKKTVARLLNEAGHRTREGTHFSDTTVSRLLADPLAKGECTDSLEVEPLISADMWERCSQLLTDAKAGDRPFSRQSVHVFAGLAQCACGTKMYVPSSNPGKYVCQSCHNKIPANDLEAVFFEQMKSFFLVPAKADDHEQTELIQTWPLMTPDERRRIVEAMTESVIVGHGKITIHLYLLPSAENAARGQRRQEGNKSDVSPSALVAVAALPLKINVGSRELWEGKAQLTHLLTETTKNFISVLGLNVANHINAPLDPTMPFADDATATAKSALDMLRRQIGSERCGRLIQLERRRGTRAGGIKLGTVEIVGTGRRDVVGLAAPRPNNRD